MRPILSLPTVKYPNLVEPTQTYLVIAAPYIKDTLRATYPQHSGKFFRRRKQPSFPDPRIRSHHKKSVSKGKVAQYFIHRRRNLLIDMKLKRFGSFDLGE